MLLTIFKMIDAFVVITFDKNKKVVHITTFSGYIILLTILINPHIYDVIVADV